MDSPASPEAALEAAGAKIETFRPVKPRGRAIGKLRLYLASDAMTLPARDYLLPGLIAPGEFSTWWGAPKCGKSFLLLRIAFCLSLGLPMWGRQPRRPIRVLYATAEGEAGFGKRVQALRAELGDPGNAFAFIAQRMTLGPPSEHLQDLIAAAKFHRADLVIVDTLARTFGEGDENHSGDMGRFISSLDQLREEGRHDEDAQKPHVAVVHHGPKDPDARMPRGSVALVGGADLVVKVTRGKADAPSTALVEWAKDDEDGAEMGFRLRKVDVGSASTCIAEEVELERPATQNSRPALPPAPRRSCERSNPWAPRGPAR